MTDSSKHSINECLSALVDGENTDADLERVLAGNEDPEVCAKWRRYNLVSSLLRKDIEQVNPVKEDRVMPDLSSRIRGAIEREATYGVDVERSGSGGSKEKAKVIPILSRFQHSVGKVAIAASVAAAFIFGMQLFQNGERFGPVQESTIASSAQTTAKSEKRSVAEGPLAKIPAGFSTPTLTARTVSSSNHSQLNTSSLPAPFTNQPVIYDSNNFDNDELHLKVNRLLLKHAEQSSSTGNMGVIPFTRVSKVSGQAE